ncbi:hypothetical protein [Spiroplasma turonicum]|uniref:Uncharacterized protein n=1 Tax=Spiroplasma turonicum TaxID=216946 RepID=A0A0K1P5W2_9MOLU|nr:hypothetical protein [Spiroplasma turonicum]AKU79564.1 hypothetical protein STURON_00318 [Spiroplasma turonicum]ALX70587.1 hypothetical protein STURO_v1c03190 [Spiroplasma turonicum]
MGIFKTIKTAFNIISYKDTTKLVSNNSIKKLVHNNNITDITIRTIKSPLGKTSNLIFKDKFKQEVGFKFVYSKGFNSFGFKEKVDVIFCNIHSQVIAIYTNLKPNKFTSKYEDAYSVFVLTGNTNKFLNIKLNDFLTTSK